MEDSLDGVFIYCHCFLRVKCMHVWVFVWVDLACLEYESATADVLRALIKVDRQSNHGLHSCFETSTSKDECEPAHCLPVGNKAMTTPKVIMMFKHEKPSNKG